MNCTIPFTKEIKFDTNIGEILSVSLENDYTINDGEILGNFTVSGEYKTHEVSVNKEHFEYVLPFSVALSERIDEDSLDFAIEDFTYEVRDENTLKVDIEYSIHALKMPEEEEIKNDDAELDSLIEEIDKETREEVEEKIEESEERNDEPMSEETKNTVLSQVSDDENYITYNIHIMQEAETLEVICGKYNTSKQILEEYNDLASLHVGDKLIIPEDNE